jgi:peptide/nickel transport system ATP-binding protein
MSGLLVAENLTVTASLGEQSVAVIEGLDFTLEQGKILGLVGESGAGKSMIARTVAQLLPKNFAATGGTLTFDGEDLLRMPAERVRSLRGRDIVFIPQEPLSALNPVLTIGQQFAEHLERLGVAPARARRERTLAQFKAVHLPHGADLIDRYPHQLSGGMCQRVLIAMAFASRPRLVIADEPTTALDVTIQARIVELIADMQERERTAVVFITHDLRLAEQICDDILVLYAGRAAEYGPARSVFATPAHPYGRCLQLANPSMHGARRDLHVLPERMPGLRALNDLTGCRFAPRCPVAISQCSRDVPPLVTVAPGHIAACLRTECTAQILAPVLAQLPTLAAAPKTAEPLLDVQALAKTFVSRHGLFGRTAVAAVKDVSLQLCPNEFLGVVGESGSGKSTLARLLVGLETPSSGDIVIAGRNVGADDAATRAHRRHHVQMVFQDPQSALNPRRRVASIVTQAVEASGPTLSPAERLALANRLLADIGLPPEAAMRYPSELSGGQRQRVNIARALCAVPKILIADEIVSGLDVSVQAQLLNLLLRLRREHGFAMLFISHDLSVVRYLCERVMVMYRGEVVESGATEAVFAAPSHPYTQALLAAVPPDDPSTVWSAQGVGAGAGGRIIG